MAWFVYVLECGDGSLYTGATSDVGRRLAEHQAGRGSRYTRAHLPVDLLSAWQYDSWSEALAAEARFKRLRRTQKLAHIRRKRAFRGGRYAHGLVSDGRERA
jgi:putative endonuclease